MSIIHPADSRRPRVMSTGVRRSGTLGLAGLLLLPTLVLYAALLVGPFLILLIESLRPYEGGRVGGLSTGWTIENYANFLHFQYFRIFRDTIPLSFIASAIGIALAYPLAHRIARTRSRGFRRFWINVLVATLFLDTLIRCYSLVLFFGPAGVVSPILQYLFDIAGNNITLLRTQVVFGLLYFAIPISVLTLVGPIENISPRLSEAAQTLGASYWKSGLAIDFRISLPAVLSSFLLTFTHSIAAFATPMILGKGFVLFIANVIYERFSESADFPGGAALSIIVLVFTLAIVYAFTRLIQLIWRLA